MPDTKITALAAITTVDPAADVLPIVDISDTSMAASGTTKKITSNQILGAGGTATLASATITGDLTVDTSTLKVDSANNRVGIGTASPGCNLEVYSSSANELRVSTITAGDVRLGMSVIGTTYNWIDSLRSGGAMVFGVGNAEHYRITSGGSFTWSDGGGGTRMTLNATGLGVGVAPYASWPATSKALQLGASSAIEGRTNDGSRSAVYTNAVWNGTNLIYQNTAAASYYLQSSGIHSWHNAASGTAGNAITFTQAMTLDASGNLLVGTTGALSAVSGSSQIALGGSGVQSISQAISATTATTICRSGSGGMAVVGGYNATGQYSAIIIFSYGAGGGVTVVSSQNNTGSTITYALSGVNVQITSSLALTNLTTTCIRTA